MDRTSQNKRADLESAPTLKNHSLSEIIRQFKTFSARYINRKQNQQGMPIWQRNYYEHIIRNQDELDQIRQYIIDNPYKWQEDENNPKSIKLYPIIAPNFREGFR